MVRIITSFMTLIFCSSLFAWEGVDKITGQEVTIEPMDTLFVGQRIPVLDHEENYWHHVDVNAIIYHSGDIAIIKGYDRDTGKLRTFRHI